jgi:integrase
MSAERRKPTTEKVRKLESQCDAGKPSKAGRSPTVEQWMITYLDAICQCLVASGKMAPRTLDDYRSKTRKWLEAAKGRRNAARWSVALALGIRQGEALGLRWSYVNLETGVIKAWFQIQRAKWQHGCEDPHECGKK